MAQVLLQGPHGECRGMRSTGALPVFFPRTHRAGEPSTDFENKGRAKDDKAEGEHRRS